MTPRTRRADKHVIGPMLGFRRRSSAHAADAPVTTCVLPRALERRAHGVRHP